MREAVPIAGVINQPFFKRLGKNVFHDGIIWGVCGFGKLSYTFKLA
jgi:hypothetical protein